MAKITRHLDDCHQRNGSGVAGRAKLREQRHGIRQPAKYMAGALIVRARARNLSIRIAALWLAVGRFPSGAESHKLSPSQGY